MVSQISAFYLESCSFSSYDFSCVVLPLSFSFSSCSFLMSILIFYLAFALFFLQISKLCLYPLWKSLSLSNSSYNVTFSFSPIANLFFKMFISIVKFPIFRLTIAMVLNNSIILSTFITSVATSSTDFGVLVYVVVSLDFSANDPRSCTILLPSSNSNGNPSTYFGLLGGTCSSTGLNSSKASCVATIFVCNLIACIFSCVYCYCYYKCCSKCHKCCGLVVVSIQSSYTFTSKCKCFSPFGNLVSCSLLTSWLCSFNYLSYGDVICGTSCLYSLCCVSCGVVIYGIFVVYLVACTIVGIVDGSIMLLIIFNAFKIYALLFPLHS